MTLKIEKICTEYGSIKLLKDVSLEINEGEIVTLIGANGAGKTTLLNTISGLTRPSRGKILFNDTRIDRMLPEEVTRIGISHVPQGRKVFPESTVLENLEIGAFIRKSRREVFEDAERLFKVFPKLEERKNQLAGSLSGGEQQMLAISRALMSRPKLLLMDEPSMGLGPLLVNEIFKIIQDLHKSGTTIFLVEQNAVKALRIAQRGYVLETGVIVLSGDTRDLANNDNVKKSYLGGG
jgi:branched-chain amino acid transport system ATP-binding protein